MKILSDKRIKTKRGNRYLEISHRTELDQLPLVGLPSPPVAGLNRPRRWISEQVVLSSSGVPLEPVTVQLETRPLASTSTRKRVTPSFSSRSARLG